MATPSPTEDIFRQRAKLSGLARGRLPGDPAVAQQRAELESAQQRAAASALCDSLDLRLRVADVGDWVSALKVPGVPIGVVLLEAVEVLNLMIGQSDRPTELLAALRDTITAARD